MPTKRKMADKVEILIAEDSPTQAEQLQYLLEQNGYQVTTAANGRLALAALAKRKPQLVISDIVMPEMDGYTLCRAIKGDKDMPVGALKQLRAQLEVRRLQGKIRKVGDDVRGKKTS